MRRTFAIVLLAVAIAGSAIAGPVLVDFSIFGLPPGNPTGIGAQNITTTPTTTRGTETTGMSFQYIVDPNALDLNIPGNLGVCGFDMTSGTQWMPGCVGAHLDVAGLFGTTDGFYQFGFAGRGATGLNFNFGISSVVFPTPLATDFMVQALFFSGPNLNGVGEVLNPQMTCAGGSCFGAFNYQGPVFQLAQVYFSPAGYTITDPNTGAVTGGTYGQNILALDTFVYDAVPEPSTFLLWAAGLMALGVVRKVVRRKS